MKKGFKVSDVNRHKRFGVVADNLQEIIAKGCQKLNFNVNCADCKVYVAEDGTLIDDDDYLRTLAPQTLLILIRNNEKIVTDFDFYYDQIRAVKKEYIDTGLTVKKFLEKDVQEKLKVFQKLVANAKDAQTILSERDQDPTWFEGLEQSEKTKEQAMSKRAKERMRGYYYKTKTALQSSQLYTHSKNKLARDLINKFLLDLRKLLELNKYNGNYFNRKADEDRICDKYGLFVCGGLWDRESCKYAADHKINPYRSREERIIFQTWNLDHKIELSRSILPEILEAVAHLEKFSFVCLQCEKNANKGCVDADRYYLQIFTRENLKLVHIVCHYKGKHEAKSDKYIICAKCANKNNKM